MNPAVYHWIGGVEVDEQWIADWVDFGMYQLELYLHNVAMFEEYCRRTGRTA